MLQTLPQRLPIRSQGATRKCKFCVGKQINNSIQPPKKDVAYELKLSETNFLKTEFQDMWSQYPAKRFRIAM